MLVMNFPNQNSAMTLPNPIFIVAMGVSGAGKSTLGAALAKAIQVPYVDGDDLHPPENVAKMANGIPLDDQDRAPWLRKIRQEGVEACKQHEDAVEGDAGKQRGLVIGCSALKRSYRDVLRGQEDEDNTIQDDVHPKHDPFQFPTRFVFISGTRDELFKRMEARKGHYMKAAMLESQLATLETPDPSTEEGIVVVDLLDTTETQVERALEGLKM